MTQQHQTYEVDDLIQSISLIPEIVSIRVNGEPLKGYAAIAYLISLPVTQRVIAPDCPSPNPSGECPGHQVQ